MGRGQGAGQDRVGQLGQAQGGQLEVRRVGHIGDGDPQQGSPVRNAQGVGSSGADPRDGGHDLVPQHLGARRRGVLEQDLEVLGVADEVLGERDGDARGQREPAPGAGIGRDRGDALRGHGLQVQRGAHDLPRVGCGTHLLEQVLGPPAHIHERGPGALCVGDAQSRQPARGGVGST